MAQDSTRQKLGDAQGTQAAHQALHKAWHSRNYHMAQDSTLDTQHDNTQDTTVEIAKISHSQLTEHYTRHGTKQRNTMHKS
jgi:hypothetical protein